MPSGLLLFFLFFTTDRIFKTFLKPLKDITKIKHEENERENVHDHDELFTKKKIFTEKKDRIF